MQRTGKNQAVGSGADDGNSWVFQNPCSSGICQYAHYALSLTVDASQGHRQATIVQEKLG